LSKNHRQKRNLYELLDASRGWFGGSKVATHGHKKLLKLERLNHRPEKEEQGDFKNVFEARGAGLLVVQEHNLLSEPKHDHSQGSSKDI